MSADVTDAAKFRILAMSSIGGIACSAVDADENLLFENIDLFIERERMVWVRYLMEYPRPSESGSAYHHRIDSITLKRLLSLFG